MIRAYRDSDYEKLKELYMHSEWYGGQFDDARDARERLAKKIVHDPDSILVYAVNSEIVGTISMIEDGRVAWLFRFAVRDNDQKVSKELYEEATKILKSRKHTQILVYTPVGDTDLDKRYDQLGMTKGSDYTCYWTDI